jgi:NAD(P)H-hydrate repair Nnr-like enzyme with NAD(P)H-hydrate dehydratase domain
MVNPTGSARLASAGTGDVLAGWIGGLWSAQPGLLPSTIAAAAVWLHGRAGESGNLRGPLPANELITAMTDCVAAWS